jgi:hypothetical protein
MPEPQVQPPALVGVLQVTGVVVPHDATAKESAAPSKSRVGVRSAMVGVSFSMPACEA